MNYLSDAMLILEDGENLSRDEKYSMRLVLEDSNSPVTRKYHEKLFKSVIDKSHIDFSGIEKSEGDIKKYSGYPAMIETLDILMKVALEERSSSVTEYVTTVKKAIQNIENLSATYAKGFMVKNDYVMSEYNVYVYTCVEAVSTLLYDFVDYIKRPDMSSIKIVLKNTKGRADLFYIEQLTKFNNVIDKMGVDYRKMLESMITKNKDNFLGVDEIVGIAAISMVALAIVPVTRELIYRVYKIRGNLAKNLELQATFLEMNKACVESNSAIAPEKKRAILEKQANLARKLRTLGDMVKVKNAKASIDSKRDIMNDNKMLTIDNLRSEVSGSPLTLI